MRVIMAKCKYCNKDMMKSYGCTITTIELKGSEYSRIKYGCESKEFDLGDGKRCHDCGAKKDYYHHLDCDTEQCPRCKGQLISCGCLE